MMGISGLGNVNTSYKPIVNPGQSTEVTPGRKSSPAECETCKNRKYQDGSDEMVSFKTAPTFRRRLQLPAYVPMSRSM